MCVVCIAARHQAVEIASVRTGAGVGLANSGVVCLMGGVHAFSVVGSWSGHDNVLK